VSVSPAQPPTPAPAPKYGYIFGGLGIALVVCVCSLGWLFQSISRGISTTTPVSTMGMTTAYVPVTNMPPTTVPPPMGVMPTPTSQPPAPLLGKIIFSFGEKQFARDLFILDLDSNIQTRLTFDESGNNFPSVSPDGSRVVYSNCPGSKCGQLYIFDINGQKSEKISSIQATFPDWCQNPSKPWIVFENESDNLIWMIDLTSKKPRQLTRGTVTTRPRWSPDCSKVIYSRDITSVYADLFVYDLENDTEAQLTFTERENEYNAAWSPNGDWIAFCSISQDTNGDSYVNLNDQSDLYLMRADGSEKRNLTQGRVSAIQPSWSPNGRYILFSTSGGQSTHQLTIYDMNSDSFKSVTGYDYYFHPRWMP